MPARLNIQGYRLKQGQNVTPPHKPQGAERVQIYLRKPSHEMRESFWIWTLQLLYDLKTLVELREDVHHRAGEKGMVRCSLELHRHHNTQGHTVKGRLCRVCGFPAGGSSPLIHSFHFSPESEPQTHPNSHSSTSRGSSAEHTRSAAQTEQPTFERTGLWEICHLNRSSSSNRVV